MSEVVCDVTTTNRGCNGLLSFPLTPGAFIGTCGGFPFELYFAI